MRWSNGRKKRRTRPQARWYRPQLVILEARTLLSFITTATYAVGNGPLDVAVGDFNGDSFPDLVTADYGYSPPDSASVLRNNGDGTFQAAHDLGPYYHGESVAVGDFNGDGRLDLVVTNYYTNVVNVLFGNGNGTFRPPHTFAVGSHPGAVAVGDFAGDGHLDIAVANSSSNTVTVLLGNGNGTFQAPISYAVGSTPSAIAVGDFAGDGHLDLAVANANSDTVSVLLGNGDGTFQPKVDYAAGSQPTGIAVGDVNGDGSLDLVVADNAHDMTGTVSVLLGNGNGTFQPAQSYQAGLSPYAVALGDFSGDGYLDIAVANTYANSVTILHNAADWNAPSTPHHSHHPTALSPANPAVAVLPGTTRPDAVTPTDSPVVPPPPSPAAPAAPSVSTSADEQAPARTWTAIRQLVVQEDPMWGLSGSSFGGPSWSLVFGVSNEEFTDD